MSLKSRIKKLETEINVTDSYLVIIDDFPEGDDPETLRDYERYKTLSKKYLSNDKYTEKMENLYDHLHEKGTSVLILGFRDLLPHFENFEMNEND